MTDTLVHINEVPVLLLSPQGPPIAGERDATDVIGDAFGHEASVVVIPVERLTDDFFTLRTRVAGDIVQKFVNYRLRLVVLGDISSRVEQSTALRDFVIESNRGKQLWFLSTAEEIAGKL